MLFKSLHILIYNLMEMLYIPGRQSSYVYDLGIILHDNLNGKLDLKCHGNGLQSSGNVFVSHFHDISTNVKDYLFMTNFPTLVDVRTRILVKRNYYLLYLLLSVIYPSKYIDGFITLLRKHVINTSECMVVDYKVTYGSWFQQTDLGLVIMPAFTLTDNEQKLVHKPYVR